MATYSTATIASQYILASISERKMKSRGLSGAWSLDAHNPPIEGLARKLNGTRHRKPGSVML